MVRGEPVLDRRFDLDERVFATRRVVESGDALRLAVLPIAMTVALIVLNVAVRPAGRGAHAAVSVLAYVALAGGSVWLAGPAARACGGWARAFGVAGARWRDVWIVPVFAVAFELASASAQVVLKIVFPEWRGRAVSNVHLHGLSAPLVVVTGVVAVMIAPPVEEFIFRGLALTVLTRRLGFRSAAVVSSLLFGALHAYEASSVPAGVILAVAFSCASVVACVLMRWQNRLAPVIAVHALANAVALTVAIATQR
jgi:membrane protease YdiL (CAAX protease family)